MTQKAPQMKMVTVRPHHIFHHYPFREQPKTNPSNSNAITPKNLMPLA